MATNQNMVNDIAINQEGLGSALTGESGTDSQNAVQLITLELIVSYRIVQNTGPDTPMILKTNKGSFAVSGRNAS
jgi:hypothetical protein